MERNSRKSIRLKGYNYANENFYYITICVKEKRCDLGRIHGGIMELSDIGKITDLFWKEIPSHFPNTILDEYIIMPNHLHGIIQLNPHSTNVGVEYIQPDIQPDIPQNESTFQNVQKNSIPSIIRSFKAAVTRWCNKNKCEYFQWQRNYYEHIIRTEEDYFRIKKYIQANPLKWNDDEYNI